MSLSSDTMTPADIAAVTNGGGFGGFGGEGSWFIIILFLFAFLGWGGRGGYGGNSGAADNYVLASDFATIQRQISDSTNSTERKLDSITNGICDLGYTNAQLINGIDKSITAAQIAQMQSANAIQSQIASCCCDVREGIAGVNYNISTQTNALQNAMCNNTRDILENQNANSRAILDALNKQTLEAKNERIAELQNKVNALNLAASQSAQNNYLINQLRPCPVPAYAVPNPFNYGNCGCSCACA